MGYRGNMLFRCVFAWRIYFRSEAMPSKCWATIEQSNSISVRAGGARAALSGEPQREDDPVVEMDVQCGPEGVQLCLHQQGLPPSAFD